MKIYCLFSLIHINIYYCQGGLEVVFKGLL